VRCAKCGCQAKIFGNARALPHKTTRYSPLAVRHSLFAIRHSLLAAVLTFASRYSLPFPDLPICRFHDLPKTWLGRNFALPLSALQKSHPPVANCQSPFAFTIRHSLLAIRCRFDCGWSKPFAIRHSLFATHYSPLAIRHSPFQKFSPTG
jgi:hypothetical protein